MQEDNEEDNRCDKYKNRTGEAFTTVAPENYEHLTRIVKSGKAGSIAEVVDQAIENFRRAQNRRRLARATSEYFDSLSPDALAEESSLAESLGEAASGINFDREP